MRRLPCLIIPLITSVPLAPVIPKDVTVQKLHLLLSMSQPLAPNVTVETAAVRNSIKEPLVLQRVDGRNQRWEWSSASQRTTPANLQGAKQSLPDAQAAI